MTSWTLIVLMVGLLPPQGMIQYGFPTKEACLIELSTYCGSPHDKQFRCKCEKGLVPPGELPPPEPPLKRR